MSATTAGAVAVNLISWNEVDKGGHLAAWQQAAIFSQELRAAFKSLR